MDPVIDSINIVPIDESMPDSKSLEIQFYRNDTLQFFIGKLVDELAFNATDSIEYQTGYYIREYPETNESIIKMNKYRMKWVTTEEPRFISPYLTLQGSPILPEQYITENDSLNPFTIQTSNSIWVQALVTFSVDTDGFAR